MKISGDTIRIARLTPPTIRASGEIVEKFSANAFSFSIVSIGFTPSGYVTPQKSFSCPITIVTAIPEVKPVVIV